MSKSLFVIIAGSPNPSSRSARLLQHLAQQLAERNLSSKIYSLDDFDAHTLLRGDTNNPQVAAFIENVNGALGLIVATPVYKGTFNGALKVIIDLIPPEALKGKLALGIATARIASHLPEAARGLRGIFDFFSVRNALPTLTFTDAELFDNAAEQARESAPFQTHVAEALERVAAELVREAG